jgi:hypothetical protein
LIARAPEPASRWRRIAWFIGLWIAGVAVLGLISFAIKLAMTA